MFKKLVAIEPVSLVDWAEEELKQYAEEIRFYPDVPKDNTEILNRIQDADAVLVSYTSRIDREVLENSPNLKYVGMCCSLYSEESANVDIACARERGIQVLGIRDYGDRGVVEFVLYELVKLLHGYDGYRWKELPEEIYQLPVGIIGLGVSGTMIGQALQSLGAQVSYYSRTRKPEREAEGFVYKDLKPLLQESQVVFACLNKNVILLHAEEFEALGEGKILFNTSIGPAHEVPALKKWLEEKRGFFVCDTAGALGDPSGELLQYPNVLCPNASAGRTRQAFELLSRKVLDNIKSVLE